MSLSKLLGRWFEMTIRGDAISEKEWSIIEFIQNRLFHQPVCFKIIFYKKMDLYREKIVSDFLVTLKIRFPNKYDALVPDLCEVLSKKLEIIYPAKWFLRFRSNEFQLSISRRNFLMLLMDFHKIFNSLDRLLDEIFLPTDS